MRSIQKSFTAGLVCMALASPAFAQNDLSEYLTKENVGKAVGAIGGALLGSQIGGGKGKLAAVALGTLAGYWLGGEIGRHLTEQDQVGIARTTQEALHTGSPQTWRNPDTGVYTRVSVDDAPPPAQRRAAGRSPLQQVPTLELINAYYTTGTAINVRGGPGTDYAVLRTIPHGERVPVIGRVQGSDWLMIAQGGVGNGFMYGPLLTRSESHPAGDNAIRQAMLRGERPQQYVAQQDDCRQITQAVTLPEGTTRRHSFTACRQSDGSWVEV